MTNPAATPSNRIGDVVVAFGAGTPRAGRDVSLAWTTMEEDQGWRLWQQLSSPSWKGFPLVRWQTEGWHILLLGELYGPHDTSKQFAAEIVRGERAATELNGHFLLWAWDEKRRQWHVWTDRFGTLHAYHAQQPGAAALGTCSSAVAQLASRRQLDSHSLAGFFGFGFFPQDRTFFDDMRILRPATHYVFSATGTEIKAARYWNWPHEPDLKRSYEDTVAEFGGVFASVMRDQLRQGLIAVPISGGLDSRCTVAAINGAHPQPQALWSYSYGYSQNSVETKIARQVAAARNLRIATFTTQPYLFEQLGRVLACVEGFQDVTQCRQAAVTPQIAAHADFIIAAHWGDVWLDTTGLADQNAPSSASVTDHALKKMAKKGRAWLLENLCAPKLGQEKPEAILRQFVDEGMKPLAHIEDADFRVKAYKTDHWSFRWTVSSFRMFQAAAFPRLPFYDTRLADFFCAVPSARLAGRRLQIDYLKRFAPDLARVRWQPYDANLYHYQHFDSWLLPKRAVKKAWRWLARQKTVERNWEVQFGGKSGEAGLSHWLLRPGLRLHDFVSRKKIATLLENFRQEPLKEGRGYTVSMLLTFSAWLELECHA
jgi:asparagine synthase (glutamine-hydrolysing)